MKGLYGLFQASLEKHLKKTFFTYAGHSRTYADIGEMIDTLSESLLKKGLSPGDRVMIFCGNSVEYIAAYFAALKTGAIAVPVNPQKTSESISYIAGKCVPGFIVTKAPEIDVLSKLDLPRSASVVDIGGLGSESITDFRGNIAVEPDEDDNAVILFTSGTTAHPKGVTLSHINLLENTRAILEYLKISPDDSVLMTLPFSYSYGNSVLLTHAAAGASLVIDFSSAYPYQILEDIKSNGVTGFSTIGSYLNLLLKAHKSAGNGGFFRSLRYITLAGEAVSRGDIDYLRDLYPELEVFVMYGQTEAGARLSYLAPELLSAKPGSIGKGLCNMELRVVNEAGGNVRPGEIGEIIARGPSVMKGYWEDPEATRRVLKNGWLHTGDCATVDEDGFIYISGRKTDIIKIMGHRISPGEIEAVLNGISCVRESAVVECILGDLPAIKAFIVPGDECSIERIKNAAASKLPYFMRPHIYELIPELPKTDTGKLRRSALRQIPCAE